MMFRHTFTLSDLLVVLWSVCAASATVTGEPRNLQSTSTRLRPIHINQYEAAMGLRRRSTEDFSDLNLQAQSEFIYGSPGGGYFPLPVRSDGG